MKEKKEIIKVLNNAMTCCFDTITWMDLIDGTDLTSEEKEWAKENTGYTVKDYTEVTAEGTR